MRKYRQPFPKLVSILLTLDAVLLVGTILIVLFVVTNQSFSQVGRWHNSQVVLIAAFITIILWTLAIITTFLGSRWSLRLHYLISAFSLLNFPIGTLYALIFLIKIRHTLTHYIEATS